MRALHHFLLPLLLLATSARSAEPRLPRNPKHADAILWQDPGRVEAKDLAAGAGGRAMVPKPPFHFLEEEMTGSSPKVKVRDANGNIFSAKFGPEVHSDPFASRLAWVVGYIVEPSHYVASGRIHGVKNLLRAKSVIQPDGTFHDARFQLRSQKAKFSKKYNWSWNFNPFVGTHELNGLKIMIMLTSDWDNKDARDVDRDANTAVFEDHESGRKRYLYFIADWGGSMGKWGNVAQRSKWDWSGYASQNEIFIGGIQKGEIVWGYSGQHTSDFIHGISVEDVRWLMRYLGRLSNRQIEAGLVACGARPEEVDSFTGAIRDRIERLRDVSQHPERFR